MDLRAFFLEQLEREATASRKVLERFPEGKGDWKPHEKSATLGFLASLVATIPGWIEFMIQKDGLDLDDPGSEMFKTRAVGDKVTLLTLLDGGVRKARCELERTTEEHLMKPWKFKMAGRTMRQEPRYQMISNGVFSHLAHHRGQFTVYLRLNEASVPALYGPSADEQH